MKKGIKIESFRCDYGGCNEKCSNALRDKTTLFSENPLQNLRKHIIIYIIAYCVHFYKKKNLQKIYLVQTDKISKIKNKGEINYVKSIGQRKKI